ncbi:MAG TPA: long-chain fatty acid--CoA ligase [Candidatus Angelobacter sp.]|nr:long-chain fatty acid--CoA ligase [Candidatus Angelobacter sp.]
MKPVDRFIEFNSRLQEFIARRRADDALFNQLALGLFALQFEHVAPYRQLCLARRVAPGGVAHWGAIPAVPAAAFKDFEMTSLPVEDRPVVFHSSGTTEQRPGRHFHNIHSLAVYESSLLPWFKSHVLPDAKRIGFILLTPPPVLAPRSSLVRMFECVRREFGSPDSVFVGETGTGGAWELNHELVVAALRQATGTRRPVALLGAAFSFVHLLDHLSEHALRFDLPPGSRVMETGGYKGRSRTLPKAELHARITDLLGVPDSQIICEYGMSELGSQAYDGAAGIPGPSSPRIFRFPPWARARIVSPETGREVGDNETGLIQVFDLANLRSVMAIQTEDLGTRRDDGFELAGRAARAEPRGCSLMMS